MKNVTSTPIASSIEPEPGPDVDRSRDILKALVKGPRDHLTCVRVFDDYYRCNWWAPEILAVPAERTFAGLEVSGFRVRKSQFVKATMRAGQLVVEDATPKSLPVD
jgi:hypothetical protein